MSDVGFHPKGANTAHKHGHVVTGVDMTGHNHTLGPDIPIDSPTPSGIREKYDTRFDDYTYYNA